MQVACVLSVFAIAALIGWTTSRDLTTKKKQGEPLQAPPVSYICLGCGHEWTAPGWSRKPCCSRCGAEWPHEGVGGL